MNNFEELCFSYDINHADLVRSYRHKDFELYRIKKSSVHDEYSPRWIARWRNTNEGFFTFEMAHTDPRGYQTMFQRIKYGIIRLSIARNLDKILKRLEKC